MSIENPKTVLCYGDSNTYGRMPDGVGRFDKRTRWTALLQKKLGPDYKVLEEGKGGRTTDIEHPDPAKPGRNGYTYFVDWLDGHEPVDVAVVMLGTNDHKNVYERTATETAELLGDYVSELRLANPATQTILVAPAFIRANPNAEYYDRTAEQKSRELVEALGKVAADEGVIFYNANEVAEVGQDGLHWTEASQEPFAAAIAERVRQVA